MISVVDTNKMATEKDLSQISDMIFRKLLNDLLINCTK